MNEEILSLLESSAPFSSLSREELLALLPEVRQKTYRPGAFVLRQGTPSLNHLFLVAAGRAEIVVSGDGGMETVVGQRRRGEVFGETVILTGKSYPASVRAAEELTCLVFTRHRIEELLLRNPGFASFFSQLLAERLRELYGEALKEQAYDAYRSDYFLFQQRITGLVARPVITCRIDQTVTDVSQIMARHGVGAILVMEGETLRGAITERDLVQKVLSRGADPQKVTAREIMNTQVVSVPTTATFGDALVAVSRHPTKYLLVADGSRPVGVVSIRDLIRARTTGTLYTAEEIESQGTIEGLAEIGRDVDRVLQALVAEKAPVPQVFEVMTALHDRLVRRAIDLCLMEMAREGYGPPPVRFCWLNLGSSGRREQTLRTDQDNALLYDDPGEDAAEVAHFFRRLGEKVVEALERCGFARCRGGVMASNPDWCRAFTAWRQLLARWAEEREPLDVRLLSIFLDFRPVYGHFELAEQLRQQVLHYFREGGLARALAEDDVQAAVPLGLLGHWRTEKGRHQGEINLKNSVCVHLVDCVRVYSLRAGITKTATLERLAHLGQEGVFSADDVELWQAAFETLMTIRIRENLKKVNRGQEPDNFVNPYHLSRRERSMLRDAMAAVARLQRLTETAFLPLL